MFLNTKNTLKTKNTIIISTIFVMAFFVLGQVALADDYGLGTTANTAFDNSIPLNTSPASIIGKVVGAALAFIGILFLILMIYGGFLWMTARGNQEQVQKAIALIISAVVGVIIIAAAYLVTQFIGETLLTPTTQ
ncbi:hypothetical protein KKH38_04040 [Patescibacteria group bacterium]|nr:hypothetical protein [Patescibacteria group bacterium]MBU4600811.1 hypothetical protein [Patescibacteria group bacterium]MCG2697553.1 hypothetical protein [Candidatus Parcubacteria bacterium]